MKRLSALDGLRGLAILFVLAYHAFPLRVGHTGVDIFFVVSGFVLWLSLNRKPDVPLFLYRRLWRLVPAMMALGLVVALVLPLFFNLYANATFSRLLEAMTFTSTYSDAQGADYFSQGFATDIFAHAWSLSVEMAMVFIMAIGALAWPYLGQYKAPLLVACTALSFFLFVMPFWSETERFHLPPFRFWAFGLGMIAAALYIQEKRFPFFWPGFLLILLSLPLSPLTILGASALAGLGTFLVLLSSWPAWLSVKPLTAIGVTSYGTYLWHLPILIVGLAAGFSPVLLLIVSLVAGALSWHLVEKPLKNGLGSWSTTGPVLLGALASIAIIGAVNLSLITPREAAQDDSFKTCHMRGTNDNTLPCMVEDPDILLWGDSHAGFYAGPLRARFEDTQTRVSVITRNGCPPAGPALVSAWVSFPGQDKEADLCRDLQDKGYAQAQDADTIILSLHWTRQMKEGGCPDCALRPAMYALITHLQEMGKTVYLIGPVPEPGWPVYFTRDVRAGMGLELPAPDYASTRARTQQGRDWLDGHGFDYLDPFDYLCNREKTHCPVKDEAGYLFFDRDHLAPAGAARIIQALPLVSSGG